MILNGHLQHLTTNVRRELALFTGRNETVLFPFHISARSHLIESPPTYNVHYGYKSWEAFSNLSYYTRALPPVANDCPTPMGVKGKVLRVNLEDFLREGRLQLIQKI